MIHPTRTVALSFRVTPDELEVLKGMASGADQTVSELIRTSLFDYAALPVPKRMEPDEDGFYTPSVYKDLAMPAWDSHGGCCRLLEDKPCCTGQQHLGSCDSSCEAPCCV